MSFVFFFLFFSSFLIIFFSLKDFQRVGLRVSLRFKNTHTKKQKIKRRIQIVFHLVSFYVHLLFHFNFFEHYLFFILACVVVFFIPQKICSIYIFHVSANCILNFKNLHLAGLRTVNIICPVWNIHCVYFSRFYYEYNSMVSVLRSIKFYMGPTLFHYRTIKNKNLLLILPYFLFLWKF